MTDTWPAEHTQLYLASASPRRLELLSLLGLSCHSVAPKIDEARLPAEDPAALVIRLAHEKATAVAGYVRQHDYPAKPIVAADTEVVVDDDVLGKPNDKEHARQILRRLSGRAHEVLTGVALLYEGQHYTALSRSLVAFAPLTDAEIDVYWASGEPADKAGAYAIQGRGAAFVRKLEGSYSGVMGLPLYELRQLLTNIGMDFL